MAVFSTQDNGEFFQDDSNEKERATSRKNHSYSKQKGENRNNAEQETKIHNFILYEA
jgi:hypothetical protein